VLDGAAKAELLGVPHPARRAFLRTGGVAVAGAVGAVAIVACGDDGGSSGDAVASTTSTTAPDTALRPTDDDRLLAASAAQIEYAAIATYDAVLAARSGDLRSIGLTDLAVVFRDHHAEHADALNGLLTESGYDAVPEGQVFAGITVPRPDQLAGLPPEGVVGLLRGLEDQATQTYLTAIPLLTLPELRRSLLSIGAIEAKHVTAIDMVVGRGLGGYASTAELIVGGNYPTGESFLTT
jgi:hypothetical protein